MQTDLPDKTLSAGREPGKTLSGEGGGVSACGRGPRGAGLQETTCLTHVCPDGPAHLFSL